MNPLIYSTFVIEAVKLAESEKSRERKKKVLKAVDGARPYAHRAFVGGMPGGYAAGFFSKNPTPKHRLAGVAVGSSVAMGDKYLENLSKKRGYRSVLKNYREEAKTASREKDVGVDLRRNGLGGVKRPPFAGPDSTRSAQYQLKSDHRKFRFNAGRSGTPVPNLRQQSVTIPMPKVPSV